MDDTTKAKVVSKQLENEQAKEGDRRLFRRLCNWGLANVFRENQAQARQQRNVKDTVDEALGEIPFGNVITTTYTEAPRQSLVNKLLGPALLATAAGVGGYLYANRVEDAGTEPPTPPAPVDVTLEWEKANARVNATSRTTIDSKSAVRTPTGNAKRE